MTSVTPFGNQRTERISLALSAVVKGKTDKETFWKEKTDLISMSRSGAGFYLTHKCEVGQLISLMMPMPKHLRCYDVDRELYRVWGLVQHCSPVSGKASAEFHVGVAFIGKQVPASYNENPAQSYRIAGMNEDGTWRIIEAKTSFVIRRHPRYYVALDIYLSTVDAERNLVMDEMAITENISLSGAAIFSKLDVNVGDSVNFDSIQHNFSATAIVRNRQDEGYQMPLLHLEFINAEFPVGEVKLPSSIDVLDEDDFTED